MNGHGRRGRCWASVAHGSHQVEPSMGAELVVMRNVGPQHPLQVPASEDEGPIQALVSDATDPALGVGVRPRRPDRCADHLGPLGAEHLVEGPAEVRVPVADEETRRARTPGHR